MGPKNEGEMKRLVLLLILVVPASLHGQSPAHDLMAAWDSARAQVEREDLVIQRRARMIARRHATGAIVGAVVGGVATYAILHSGGSTAPCNRSENQDAIGSGECLGITAAGAVVGGGVGYLIGGLFRRGLPEVAAFWSTHVAVQLLPGRRAGATFLIRH